MNEIRFPTPEVLADRYCMLVAEAGFHYHPERMPYLYSQRAYRYPDEKSLTGEVYKHEPDLVYPGDVCDDNMSMDAALRMFNVDTDAELFTEDGLSQELTDLWNAAFKVAERNRFMPTATLKGKAYLCVWYEGYGDAGAEIVRPDFFTFDRGFTHDDLLAIDELGHGGVYTCAGVLDEMAVVYLGDDVDRSVS